MSGAYRMLRLPAVAARYIPSRADYSGLRRSWRGDIVGGITVGVVALPLALAFGITTGLGAEAGLMTAIVAGLVAGVFGGFNVAVSGPTGAMTVVVDLEAQQRRIVTYVDHLPPLQGAW
ncbi:MAG TPA: SulP family inorganic anion transporter [Acidimicrobiales bacterium]|nr:SulP family inorganic anion transporter [Acidimicrobiales bacterium]